jgi:hypothetical protein
MVVPGESQVWLAPPLRNKKGGFGKAFEGVSLVSRRWLSTSTASSSDQPFPNPSCGRYYAGDRRHTRGILGVTRRPDEAHPVLSLGVARRLEPSDLAGDVLRDDRRDAPAQETAKAPGSAMSAHPGTDTGARVLAVHGVEPTLVVEPGQSGGRKPRARKGPKGAPTHVRSWPLRPSAAQGRDIRTRFLTGARVYNAVLGEFLARSRAVKSDPAWEAARLLPYRTPAERTARRAAFRSVEQMNGSTVDAAQSFASSLRKSWVRGASARAGNPVSRCACVRRGQALALRGQGKAAVQAGRARVAFAGGQGRTWCASTEPRRGRAAGRVAVGRGFRRRDRRTCPDGPARQGTTDRAGRDRSTDRGRQRCCPPGSCAR